MKQIFENKIVKNTIGVVATPLLFFVVMYAACAIKGGSLFSGSFSSFATSFVYVLVIAFGVSINLHTGRFDFAVGSIILLSGVVGAKIIYVTGAPTWLMIVICLATGTILGTISGVLYSFLKLPPMIIGLSCALIYEALSYIVVGNGVNITMAGTDLYTYNNNYILFAIVIIISVGIMIYLFDYTRFGFDYKALQNGQKIAVNTGVNEVKNAIICYALAGAFFGFAGFMSIVRSNQTVVVSSFASINTMFVCFLPLFISSFLIRFVNKQIAILIGVLCYAILTTGFAGIYTVDVNFSSDVYSIIESIILVLLLIYLNNETRLKDYIRKKLKKDKVSK